MRTDSLTKRFNWSDFEAGKKYPITAQIIDDTLVWITYWLSNESDQPTANIDGRILEMGWYNWWKEAIANILNLKIKD